MNQATAPLTGIPADIRCAQDYERIARRFMPESHYAYIAGGSGHGVTVDANRAAFDALSLYPRLLRDVRSGHTRQRIGSTTLAHPIVLAPVAFQKLAHPAGELESALAATATDTCMVLSTLATTSLESVAEVGPVTRWFQLYFQPRHEVTLDLVRRAEKARYGALMLTLDATLQVPGHRARAAGFEMPASCEAINLAPYPQPPQVRLEPGQSRVFQGIMSEAPCWDDLAWLLAQSTLPLWVKGVLHPDDARLLKECGVAGIVVSNHGGRSLDGAPASLNALPAIREAVGPGYPVLFDSGIRSGNDVFKALALGADAVMIGRLQVYALAVAGALGVAHLIRLLREELEACMALTGCATLDDITPASIFP